MPSSNHFAGWESGFLLGKEAVYGTLVSANLKAMPLTGRPTLDVLPEIVDSGETGRGRAERYFNEYGPGRNNATVGFETDLNETRAYHALRALFQFEATKTGTGPFKFEWNPYTAQPTANLGYSIQTALRQGATTGGVQILGAIGTTFKASSQSGQFAKLGASYRGKSAALVTPATTGNTWDGEVVLMHQNAYANVTPQGGSLLAIDPANLEVNIANNAAPWFGASQTPNDIVLGVMDFNGSFRISAKPGMTPWQNLIDAKSILVTMGWGALGLPGNIEFEMDAMYQTGELGEEGIIQTTQFGWRHAKRVTVTRATLWATADLSA